VFDASCLWKGTKHSTHFKNAARSLPRKTSNARRRERADKRPHERLERPRRDHKRESCFFGGGCRLDRGQFLSGRWP
jgi:hypothetical protein